MPTPLYPTTLFTAPASHDYTPGAETIGPDVERLEAETAAVQAELGIAPRGTFATVKARIDDLATGKANAADVATDAELAVQTARIDALATAVFNDQAASYTLVLADAGKIVGISNASANTLTVPTAASVAFPTGTTITLRQRGAGQTTVAGATGVTVNSRGAALKLAGQYAFATLIKTPTADTWALSGDLVV